MRKSSERIEISGFFDAGGIEDVHDLFAHEGFIDDLADRRFDFLIAPPGSGAVELHKTGLHGLEEGDFIAGFHGPFVGNGDGISLREGRHFIDETLFAVRQAQDMFFGLENNRELAAGAGAEIVPIGETVEHRRDDFKLFLHETDCLFLGGGGVALPARIRVEREGFLEIGGYAEIVDNKPAFLVLVDTVDPRDGLHECMAFHGLVYVHRMHTGEHRSL